MNKHLLGGLLLLLLLLLSLSFILLCGCFLNNWWWCLFLLLFLLDGNEKTNNILGLDHVIFINLKFTEDVVNLSIGHLVSPGLQGVCEHLGVNLALVVVSLESLDDEVINVVKSTTEVIFVKLAILVDVHELEAVLVHLELVLGESSLILALAHLGVRVSSSV